MKIDVNQRAISIGDKYTIFINGSEEYFASVAIFTLLAEITLSRGKGKDSLLMIKKRLAFFKARYDIKIGGTETLEFITTSILKKQYRCIQGFDTYDIYANRGRKYSIYKNDIQIAWFEDAAVTWFNGDNYSMQADDDINKELLIAFCLIIDNYANNDRGKSALNINIGNLGVFGAKKFDKDWQPKKLKLKNRAEEEVVEQNL